MRREQDIEGSTLTDSGRPLAGIRVIDYSQFVAGPLCTMLLANLGADVIKVESPAGDAYRHYEPLGDGESTRFYALNQGKRSVVCDLKSADGRELSRRLIASGDVILHNMPQERARTFGLDSETVRKINDSAVVVVVSAFGMDGSKTGRVGYDLIAQAYSGLLMADAGIEDDVPRRKGGVPFSDITSGLLACISALVGLTQSRNRPRGHFEVSLLAAALLTQIQDFVRLESAPAESVNARTLANRSDLAAVAKAVRNAAELEPYYRCYEAADGYFALACLTTTQRKRVLEVLGLDDPWVANPQSPPADDDERQIRINLAKEIAVRFQAFPAGHWVDLFNRTSVPASEVRMLGQLFDDEQVGANGLVRRRPQVRGGDVDLFGTPFKVDGKPMASDRSAPRLGQHNIEVSEELLFLKRYANDS